MSHSIQELVRYTWKIPNYFSLSHTAKTNDLICGTIATFINWTASFFIRDPYGFALNASAYNSIKQYVLCRIDLDVFLTSKDYILVGCKINQCTCNETKKITDFQSKPGSTTSEFTNVNICIHEFIEVYCDIEIKKTSNHQPKITDIFNIMLKSQKYGDVLFNIGKEKIRAYKGILAVRSSVFEKMFEHQTMIENQKQQVDITDIRPEVFGEMLVYIYTSETTKVHEMPLELFAAAHKYQLIELEMICENVIYKNISPENAVEIYKFAELYSSLRLRIRALEIIRNNQKRVLESDGYKTFKQLDINKAIQMLEIAMMGEA